MNYFKRFEKSNMAGNDSQPGSVDFIQPLIYIQSSVMSFCMAMVGMCIVINLTNDLVSYQHEGIITFEGLKGVYHIQQFPYFKKKIMFKKLREQVEGLESPKKDESSSQTSRRRSSMPVRNKSNQKSGVMKSDSSSSLTSISEADVLSGQISHDDLLSAFMHRTNQLKKLEIKLSDYSQALKESNKEKDKLANVLEKQQDTAMKRMSELEETYAEGKLNMEKTIAKLEKKESGFTETIEMLRGENKKLRMSVEKFVKEKNDFEKKRDAFYEKRDNSEELNDLQMQELAKVKHMLMMREKDCDKYRQELDQKVAELLQSQDTNEQMEGSLRKTTDSLNANVKELEVQLTANNEIARDLKECSATISELNVEIVNLKNDLSSLNSEMNKNEAKLKSLESENANVSEKYDSLKHSSENLLSKANVELDEKQATIDHLQQKISLLENRVTTEKLPESEQVQALIQERASLENKLEESYLQLNNIKSTWSVKINQLEQQVSHLNKKIAEDQEELTAREAKISQFESSKSSEMDSFRAKIKELESEVEKSQLSNERYLQQITQLEADMIERTTVYDLEKQKLFSAHKKEIERCHKIQEELKNEIQTALDSLAQNTSERNQLNTEISQLKSDFSQSKEELQKLQKSYDKVKTTNESLQQERDGLNDLCLNCNTKIKILEEKLVTSQIEIDELTTKVVATGKVIEEKLAEIQSYDEKLNAKGAELQKYESSFASNASQSQEFEEKIRYLESRITSREEELINCKTEIATLKNSQAEESEEVVTLKAERTKADELLAERERLIKVQQQRLNDLKKALNKELNKKQTMSHSGSGNQRTGSPRREFDVNGVGNGTFENTLPDVATIGTTSIADPSVGSEPKEINIKYLKHVVLTFLGGSPSEAQQLIKALGTLLNFNRDEEKFVKETLDYRGSWFGAKPNSKKVGARPSRR